METKPLFSLAARAFTSLPRYKGSAQAGPPNNTQISSRLRHRHLLLG